MNPSSNPVRLRGLYGPASVLGQGLAAARSSVPSEKELEALERRLFAGIGAASLTAATVQGAKTTRGWWIRWLSTGGAKWAAGVAGVVAIGGGGLWARLETHSVPPQPVVPALLRPVEPLGEPAPGNAAPSGVPLPETGRAAPTPSEYPSGSLPGFGGLAAPSGRAPRAAKALPVARAQGPLVGPAASSDDEVPLLEQAHRALSGSPALALALAMEHRQRFPESSFDQERELIAVSALVRLGRTAEAERRARRFAAEHPGSAHMGRIDSVLRAKP